jgi:hypothetical protein
MCGAERKLRPALRRMPIPEEAAPGMCGAERKLRINVEAPWPEAGARIR